MWRGSLWLVAVCLTAIKVTVELLLTNLKLPPSPLLYIHVCLCAFSTHSATMACVGKLELEIDVKSSSDKFWKNMRDSTIIFPKAFPHDYKSIEVLEGDGKAVGSIRLISYAEGSLLAKESKEKIEAVDEEKKTVSYSVIEGDLLKYYKSFKGHISVSPKGEGSSVKWSCEYEKASEEVPDPHIIKDFVVKNFRELDAYTILA